MRIYVPNFSDGCIGRRVPAFLWSMLANLSKDSGSKLRGLDAAQVSRRQQGGLPWLTISCSGTFRQCWDLCSLTAVIYCTFAVPYDMTFDPPKGVVASAIDMGVEVFFMTEIVLNFFTSYINEDGVEIKNKQLILANYALSWMPIDLVSSIPAEIIRRVATADGGSASNFEILERLRILRILRLTKLLRLLRIANFMEQIEFSFPSLRTVIGLFRLLFLMGTVAHMQACIFYFIASTNLGNSWVSRLHFGCCDPQLDTFTAYSLKTDDISCMDDVEMPKLGSLYANAIYWSFTTLTTVGYGDIVPCNEMEMLFATSSMVVGSALFAYIVGNIASVVTSIKGQELKLKERMRELQEYIALRKIPKQLADQVRRQCMHLWKNTVFEEDKVLNEFTPQLRKEVVSFVNDHILHSVPTIKVFEGEPILTEIALKLKPSSATAGEVITGYGEIFCDLYILQGGKVEVLDENGVAIETFSTHGSFNELELLSPLFNYTEGATEPVPMRYTTTLRALTFCDLMVLKSTDFQEVLNANGLTDDTVLLETLEKRWTKLLKRMEKRTAFSQQLASENMTVESEHKMRKEWQSARHASLESEGLAPRTATTVAVRRFMRSQSGRDMSPIPVEIEEAPDKMTKRRIERPPSPHRAALHRERRESILSEGSVGEVIGRESPVRGRSQTRRGSTRSAQSGSRDTSPLATDVRHATPLTEALAEARIDDGEHSAGSVAEEGRKLLVGHEEGSHGGRGWNAMRKLKESFTDEASPGRQKPRRPSLEVCVEAFQHGLRARSRPVPLHCCAPTLKVPVDRFCLLCTLLPAQV